MFSYICARKAHLCTAVHIKSGPKKYTPGVLKRVFLESKHRAVFLARVHKYIQNVPYKYIYPTYEEAHNGDADNRCPAAQCNETSVVAGRGLLVLLPA